ncbi:hypothetical protein PI125_g3613 [Phytophthora idaei]|nr:hypothetical protein PI125_g3613 [Phytophthora idaei]KAG3148402.1 hypothetical protein PI126_g12453 [Phytophthora idaei]
MKNVIMKSFLLDEVISTLMTLQEWAEDAYMGESNRVGSQPHIEGEDQEFSALAMQISSHSFEYVKTEYNFAISGDAHYTIDMSMPGQARLTRAATKETHRINTKVSFCLDEVRSFIL